ncbi:MAG: hypothetical protein WCK21_02625 [Actinomycetota bacterium]
MRHFRTRVVGTLALIVAATLGATIIASADAGTLSTASGTAAVNGDGTRDVTNDVSFVITLPGGAHCSGNNSSGYVVRSYFIGSAVTLSSVDFGVTGLPLPASGAGSGTSFVSALPKSTGATFQVNPNSSSPFLVTGLPQLSLYRMVGLATIPAGTYHMGIACVNPQNQVDGTNFWDVAITISSQSATSLTWGQGTTTSTTSTTSTTTTTTTTPGGGGSSTTSTTSTTTTSVVIGGSTTTTTHPMTTTTIVGSGSGTLVQTGSSPWRLVVLTLLVLMIGRMVLLTARPVRVLPQRSE